MRNISDGSSGKDTWEPKLKIDKLPILDGSLSCVRREQSIGRGQSVEAGLNIKSEKEQKGERHNRNMVIGTTPTLNT